MRRDAVESGPFQGEVGQPVLRDLEGRPRGSHPAPQIRHFGHRQTLIAGDHDHRRVGATPERARRRIPASPYGPVSSPFRRRAAPASRARPGYPWTDPGFAARTDPVRLSIHAGTTKSLRRPVRAVKSWLPRLPRAGLRGPLRSRSHGGHVRSRTGSGTHPGQARCAPAHRSRRPPKRGVFVSAGQA